MEVEREDSIFFVEELESLAEFCPSHGLELSIQVELGNVARSSRSVELLGNRGSVLLLMYETAWSEPIDCVNVISGR